MSNYLDRTRAFDVMLEQLELAEKKHHAFPANDAEGLAVIAEELGELAQAVNDGLAKDHLIEEAAHVAVTAFRFIEEKVKDNHKCPKCGRPLSVWERDVQDVGTITVNHDVPFWFCTKCNEYHGRVIEE